MRSTVVTGIGCITPIGIGLGEFSESLRRGASGVGTLTLFDASPYNCKVAAQARGFEPREFMPEREARSSPRVVQFGVAAARLAMQDAGFDTWPDPSRVGFLMGTSVGPSAYNFEQFAIFIERGVRRMQPTFPAQAHYGVIASECAIQLGIHGPVMCISSACTSSADALGLGRAMIEAGMADVILAGGAEAPICPLLFAAFDRLNMMPVHFNDRPEVASRPFAADRDGFVLGEGAAVLVLERADHAAARGAKPIAEVAGYAATCDAFNHFSQAEGGDDAARAISLALQMAGATSDSVSYVNAHGSATLHNDTFETGILHRVLGQHAKSVPVSSTKSMLGHLLGASGAVELAATLVGMRDEFFPPTINLEVPDPACDLDYVPQVARPGRFDVALSVSFGFGSRNAAVVVKRPGGGDGGGR
jgi:3-oxoacyl-[acyl-carrier-protein] synthase II